MDKPDIQLVKYVDLLQACLYLEANGFPYARKVIFEDAIRLADKNGEMLELPCFHSKEGAVSEGYMPYGEQFVKYHNALWALYPEDDDTLLWKVTWY
jgi:hypothetical protein